MAIQHRLPLSLLGLRLGVFVVMFFWTLDKFVRPEHASAVYKHFYGINLAQHEIMYGLAALEMILLAAFLFGIKRRFSYGLVLVLHGVSTLSSWQQYTHPFQESNLLFFAAWPMLAACVMLYLMRDQDNLMTFRQFG
jgi:putative oxidoreductase